MPVTNRKNRKKSRKHPKPMPKKARAKQPLQPSARKLGKVLIHQGKGGYRGKGGLFYWRAIAPNGKIIADGAEGYSAVRKARDGFWALVGLIRSNQYRFVNGDTGEVISALPGKLCQERLDSKTR